MLDQFIQACVQGHDYQEPRAERERRDGRSSIEAPLRSLFAKFSNRHRRRRPNLPGIRAVYLRVAARIIR